MVGTESKPVRVLVVDDSAYSRQSIVEGLGSHPDLEVVGKAIDGEEALRLSHTLKPDVITLDLEMPRMDGFTFLRILMKKRPVPVIIVSSYSQKENVFRALELGAFDFVAKPDRFADADFRKTQEDLLRKILLVRDISVLPTAVAKFPAVAVNPLSFNADKAQVRRPPRHIVAIASSTGGPNALIEIFSRQKNETKNTILVAQHMPDKFTRTFAERLDRRSALKVAEAQDLDPVSEGVGYVCPGGRSMELEAPQAGMFRVRVLPPHSADRYAPSADRLLTSVAAAAGTRSVAVILTGMGDDGVQGARCIQEAGGLVIAESEETAVVYGMPRAAVNAGVVSHSLRLPEIADFLARL